MIVRLYFFSLLAPLGFLTVLLGLSTRSFEPSQLSQVKLVPNWDSPWVKGFVAPDPVVEGLVQQYIQKLAGEGWYVPGQGVWIQTGQATIAQHQGNVPLSAASLTKIATTLSALETWDPNHQFETLVGMTGTLENGVLNGDLVIKGGSDPLFVWEEAIVMGNALQQLGIRQVTGNLVIAGDFVMNFNTNPFESGQLLLQAWNADLWPPAAWDQYRSLPAGTAQPTIQVNGTVQVVPPEGVNQVSSWRLRHQSLPLIAILKAMNIYSNNVMSEMMAEMTGGAGAVMAKATQAANLVPGELRLVNGSGLGAENQISPRAVTAMLATIQEKLRPQGFSVADVLPIAGEDVGTLADRRLPLKSGLKTGTLAEVSALAGFIPTQERGPVWFTIINWGWDLDGLRRHQDELLNQIQSHWGVADAPSMFQPKVRLSQGPYQLGDPRRNQPFGEQ
ncbi:MAG: D-alanyl-D-alanine carboxypeptidase [Cyanobacteria bacterium Co-bin13]|nr:D-alanyl-D-alanine carboxypeptidase [Cyanobacteria bacterium Co-bin13]